MRALNKILVGLGLVSMLGGSAQLAHATGGAQQQAKKQKPFKFVAGANARTQTAHFAKEMSDEIQAIGDFKGKQNDTPTMFIVPLDGKMIQTKLAAVDVNDHDIGGPGGEFAYHGPAAKTKFKVLVPVSAHYGLPYKEYAAGNEYEVWVEDKGGKTLSKQIVKSTGFGKAVSSITDKDLVTEVEVELPFDKGTEFRVSFTPTATGKNGYTSGREVVVRLAGSNP